MSQKIKTLVIKLLESNKISNFPIDLKKILKFSGITLNYSVFEDSISGLLYKKKNKNIIVVNSLHPEVRQRFTIAHELGHYFLNHHSNLFIDKGNLYRDKRSSEGNIRWEREANKFAAELLMPEEMLRRFIKKESIEDLQDIDLIAGKIKVSTEALTYKLSDIGMISLY